MQPGGVAFFFFSGHGLQGPADGRNYLIPVEGVESDALLEDDALSMERVHNCMAGRDCLLWQRCTAGSAAAALLARRWRAHAAALQLLQAQPGLLLPRAPAAALLAAQAARQRESDDARHARLHGAATEARYSLLLQMHDDAGDGAPVFAASAPLLTANPDALQLGDGAAVRLTGGARVTVHTDAQQASLAPGRIVASVGIATPLSTTDAAAGCAQLRVRMVDLERLTAHAWLLRETPDGGVELARWATNEHGASAHACAVS